MTSMRRDIARYWRELARGMRLMPFAELESAADLLLDCRRRNGTIFLIGNGGSAATASHFACDLAKGARTSGHAPFRAVPLTDNVPLMTAWGNDTSYDRIFAEQLAALVRPGDLVIAISASGNSPNILRAVETAAEAGATSLALTGRTGGAVATIADLVIRVPLDGIEQVEDAHVIIAHSLCVALRERLAGEVVDPATSHWAVEDEIGELVADLDR